MHFVVVYGPPGSALEQYVAMIQRSAPDVTVAAMAISDAVTPEAKNEVRRALLTGRGPVEAQVLARVADLVLELCIERAARAEIAQAEEVPQ